MAPELGDRPLLPLLVTRVKADGTGPQGVDQQAIGPARLGGKQDLPGREEPAMTGDPLAHGLELAAFPQRQP